MSTSPYVVTVKNNKEGVHVRVHPQPVAVKDEYIAMISGKIDALIVEYSNKPISILTRSKLKKELNSVLTDFHQQGLIKPKDD